MAAGILFVMALMLLATQLMVLGRTGAWQNITIASEFDVPTDPVSAWALVDKPIHFLLHDTQLWILLLFAAALTYWLTDWGGEKLGLAAKCAPPPPPRPEPQPEHQPEKSELADSGTTV